MSWFPNEQEALDLLVEVGCQQNVVEHSEAVAAQALELCGHLPVVHDRSLIKIGSLLHDIGRAKTHDVTHGFVGAEILRSRDVDERLALIAERHVGAGIPAVEAAKLGLPKRDFLPETIEEKIVCYADKLTAASKPQRIEAEAERLREKLGPNHPAIKRLADLEREMKELLE